MSDLAQLTYVGLWLFISILVYILNYKEPGSNAPFSAWFATYLWGKSIQDEVKKEREK